VMAHPLIGSIYSSRHARVPLDKSEGLVKQKLSLAMPEHRFLCMASSRSLASPMSIALTLKTEPNAGSVPAPLWACVRGCMEANRVRCLRSLRFFSRALVLKVMV